MINYLLLSITYLIFFPDKLKVLEIKSNGFLLQLILKG